MAPLIISLLIAFSADDALACSRTAGSAPFDIQKALALSISDSAEWKGSEIISTGAAPKKLRPKVSHLARVYKPSDQTCFDLEVYLYGGNGDCQERVDFVRSEKIGLQKCKTKR